METCPSKVNFVVNRGFYVPILMHFQPHKYFHLQRYIQWNSTFLCFKKCYCLENILKKLLPVISFNRYYKIVLQDRASLTLSMCTSCFFEILLIHNVINFCTFSFSETQLLFYFQSLINHELGPSLICTSQLISLIIFFYSL